jgi:hypothetical protein
LRSINYNFFDKETTNLAPSRDEVKTLNFSFYNYCIIKHVPVRKCLTAPHIPESLGFGRRRLCVVRDKDNWLKASQCSKARRAEREE